MLKLTSWSTCSTRASIAFRLDLRNFVEVTSFSDPSGMISGGWAAGSAVTSCAGARATPLSSPKSIPGGFWPVHGQLPFEDIQLLGGGDVWQTSTEEPRRLVTDRKLSSRSGGSLGWSRLDPPGSLVFFALSILVVGLLWRSHLGEDTLYEVQPLGQFPGFTLFCRFMI